MPRPAGRRQGLHCAGVSCGFLSNTYFVSSLEDSFHNQEVHYLFCSCRVFVHNSPSYLRFGFPANRASSDSAAPPIQFTLAPSSASPFRPALPGFSRVRHHRAPKSTASPIICQVLFPTPQVHPCSTSRARLPHFSRVNSALSSLWNGGIGGGSYPPSGNHGMSLSLLRKDSTCH